MCVLHIPKCTLPSHIIGRVHLQPHTPLYSPLHVPYFNVSVEVIAKHNEQPAAAAARSFTMCGTVLCEFTYYAQKPSVMCIFCYTNICTLVYGFSATICASAVDIYEYESLYHTRVYIWHTRVCEWVQIAKFYLGMSNGCPSTLCLSYTMPSVFFLFCGRVEL